MMAVLSFLFRVVVAVLLAMVGAWYFGLIWPGMVALCIGIAIGAIELFGPFIGGRASSGGYGGGMGAGLALLRVAAGVLTWPGFAWLVMHFGGADRGLAAAIAATPAVLVGIVMAGYGPGGENRRLTAAVVSGLVALIALLEALPSGRAATAAGCVAVAAALFVARATNVWPRGHVRALDSAAVASLFAAGANVLIVWLFTKGA